MRSAEHGFGSALRSAEHGFKSLKRSAEHGFTLIELMVVIVIIGLASAAVVMAIPDPRGRLTEEADRFAVRAAAVRDDAIVQARDVSIVIDSSGYRVERRAAGRWHAAGDRLFAPVTWGSGTQATLGQSGTLRVTFDSTGTAPEPLTLDLSREGEAARISIAENGTIHVGP